MTHHLMIQQHIERITAEPTPILFAPELLTSDPDSGRNTSPPHVIPKILGHRESIPAFPTLTQLLKMIFSQVNFETLQIWHGIFTVITNHPDIQPIFFLDFGPVPQAFSVLFTRLFGMELHLANKAVVFGSLVRVGQELM